MTTLSFSNKTCLTHTACTRPATQCNTKISIQTFHKLLEDLLRERAFTLCG